MRNLGVGVLGLGEMGRYHATNIRRMVPQARLVAVADVLTERARQVAEDLEVNYFYNSLEALLDNKEIEAVVIATPDRLHAEGVMAAVRAGKAVLCEKPLALNLADAHAVLAEVTRTGARLQVGFMRRYDPAYQAALRRVESGEIGIPLIFKSVGRDKDGPTLAAYQSGANGMMFYTNTIHDFDLARWLMRDEVEEVHAYTTTVTRPELADYGDVVASVVNLRYRQGAIGNVESFAQAVYGYDVRTEIVGSKGSILIGSLGQSTATFLTSKGGVWTLSDHFLSRFAEAYLQEVRDFVHNVLHERPLQVSGDDGLAALAISAAAEESHRKGKPIRVSTELSSVRSEPS